MKLFSRFQSLFKKNPPKSAIEFSSVSSETLKASLQAGLAIQEIQESLKAEGIHLIERLLQGKPHDTGEHYPWQGGVLDQRHNSQYFYHSHDDYYDEHGHFHTFAYHQRQLVHLVALGHDDTGKLLSLYTFNRWSTGDAYFPADGLKSILQKFNMESDKKFDSRVNAYVQNVLTLFRAEIEMLFEERDETFEDYREDHGGESPFEDRSLEITSDLKVNIPQQIKLLQAELDRRAVEGEPTIEELPTPEKEPVLETVSKEIVAPPYEQRNDKQIEQSLTAGVEIQKLNEKFKAEGKTVLDVVMKGQPLEVWKMYPWEQGVIDKKNKSQYFYHTHPQSSEHGHFHTFYHHQNELVHLVAIAFDNAGNPIEIMTVNRWVTGDLYVPEKKLKSFLPKFRVSTRAIDRRLNQYIRHMLMLYQPEIHLLFEQREHVFKDYRQQNGGASPFEDRSLEVTSFLPIDPTQHIAQLEAEQKQRQKS